MARAGLKSVTPHTLRHTQVSELAQAGEKQINISAYMAMSPQTIAGIYAHVNNVDVNAMAERIGRSQKIRTTGEPAGEDKEKRDKGGDGEL